MSGALVELVVADDHRVGADRARGPDLRLAEEVVEDGRPLEEVACVEVEHAVGARALATEDVRHGGDAADVRDAVVGPETELGVDLLMIEYGKSREWTSPVCRRVRCTWHVCPGGDLRAVPA